MNFCHVTFCIALYAKRRMDNFLDSLRIDSRLLGNEACLFNFLIFCGVNGFVRRY